MLVLQGLVWFTKKKMKEQHSDLRSLLLVLPKFVWLEGVLLILQTCLSNAF